MFKNFQSFIRCIESLPHEQLSDQQMQARLSKGREFLEAQALLPNVPVITVTGTNGKGSGETRQKIALEKLGLLRRGIPLICAEPDPPVAVLKKTNALACELYQINKRFGFECADYQWDLWFEDVMFCSLPLPMMHLRSISAALQAVKILFPQLQLTQKFLSTQLAKITLPARFQKMMYQGIEFVIDVSHNPTAVEALANFLRELAKKPTYAIFGAKLNKDISGMISRMQNVIQDWYLVPMHGVRLEALTNIFSANKISAHAEIGVTQAIESILQKNLGDIRVVVFGSFLVVGEMLALVNKKHF